MIKNIAESVRLRIIGKVVPMYLDLLRPHISGRSAPMPRVLCEHPIGLVFSMHGTARLHTASTSIKHAVACNRSCRTMRYLFLEHRCDHARHRHGRVNHSRDRANNPYDRTDVSRCFPTSAWPFRCPEYFLGISVAAPIPCVFIRHRRGRADYPRHQ